MKRLWVILFVIPLFAQRVPDKNYFQDFIELESQLKYTELKDYFNSKSEEYEQLKLVEELLSAFGGVGTMLDSIDFRYKILEIKTMSKDNEFLIMKIAFDITFGIDEKLMSTYLGIALGELYGNGIINQFWIFKIESNEWKLWSRVNLDNVKEVVDVNLDGIPIDSLNVDSLLKRGKND
jgi:hypothetical protein